MTSSHDVRLVGLHAYLIPVAMRVPLKFGSESIDSVNCLRIAATVEGSDGRTSTGWGETPLSVTWAWPSAELDYDTRLAAMVKVAKKMANQFVADRPSGHPMHIGQHLIENIVRPHHDAQSSDATDGSDPATPHLAALVIASAMDIAVHDAYGRHHGRDIYELYGQDHLPDDLSHFVRPEENPDQLRGRYLSDLITSQPPKKLPVWHLVGGLDALDTTDLVGDEPDDGYPVTLRQWIERDGLSHLKIKLRGNDADWDEQRIRRVHEIASPFGGATLSVDFNCTVHDPAYVNEILDELRHDAPEIFDAILYVEQPFPYDLDAHQIDVRSVSQRKPLFLDESAHDWQFVRLGYSLGWSGVALKTCKTQTGALLSMAYAKSVGMPLMVQDLTNPMLAQIPHVRLAAHVGTIAGVESNGMQFYPDASLPEAKVHPGLYRRRDGVLDLTTIGKEGFGYRLEEIERTLPEPVFEV